MKYEIILSSEALDDFNHLPANVRAMIRDALNTFLQHEPTKLSKSRIKRLRGLSRPQYRLRVDEMRVYYDATSDMVEVLAIIPKDEADLWLAQAGEPDEDSSLE